MAFSIQQINEFFDQFKEDSYFLNAGIKADPNYPIVVDYLTGISNSLAGLQSTHDNYQLSGLVALIESFEHPSPNDQLLLDVLSSQNVFPYVSYQFSQAIIWNAVHKNTQDALDAAVASFKAQGMTDATIYELFIFNLRYSLDGYRELLSSTSVVKNYLVRIIPKQLSLASYPGSSWSLQRGNDWNYLHLLLLEEAQKDVKDFIIEGLTGENEEVINLVISHDDGKYCDVINNCIMTSQQKLSPYSKLITSVRLFEKDKDVYLKTAVHASGHYIDYLKQEASKDRWERCFHFTFFGADKPAYVAASAVAFHFLILNNASSALSILKQLFDRKTTVSFDVLRMLATHSKEMALPYLKLGLLADASAGGIEYYRKIIDLLMKEFEPLQYLDIFWLLTGSKSKPLREHIAKILFEADRDAERKAISLLQTKNAETRQAAALMLSFSNSDAALGAVKEILAVEANDNARDILLQIASRALPDKPSKDFVKAMIVAAAKRNKLDKPIPAPFIEEGIPPLFYVDGDQLDQQEVRFLLYRISRIKSMRPDIEAKYLLSLVDKERSGPFVKHMINTFVGKGARPEYKYLMALAALLGNEDVVDKIKSTINGWIDENRTKMAEYGIGALAMQGSDKALRQVEYYSRKYKNKTASVGKAALQSLENAAEELHISTHELGDRIVPDFGFEDLFKHFVVNGEEYRAFVDSNFKLAFFNEDNKKLKSPPAGTTAELKEDFKKITKEIRDVVKSQSLRLEYYLVIQRRWNKKEWIGFYLTNPVMFIYATRLLWGIYDSQGKLRECFLCQEDTTLSAEDDNEIELDDQDQIGLVHPLQLTSATLQMWKQKFYDMAIDPVFPQLDRSIAHIDQTDRRKKIQNEFLGVETESGGTKSTLEKYGWRKGDASDGGFIDHFSFQSTVNNIEAIIEVEGVFVGGYGWDSEPKLGRLYFLDRNIEKSKWFATPKDDKDERLVILGDVDEIFYSEVMSSIRKVPIKQKTA